MLESTLRAHTTTIHVALCACILGLVSCNEPDDNGLVIPPSRNNVTSPRDMGAVEEDMGLLIPDLPEVVTPASIELSDETIKLEENKRIMISARALDEDGMDVREAVLQWSLEEEVATLSSSQSSSGMNIDLTATTPGTTELVVEAGLLRRTIQLEVIPGPRSLVVTPEVLELRIGDELELTADMLLTDDSSVPGLAMQWVSEDADVVDIQSQADNRATIRALKIGEGQLSVMATAIQPAETTSMPTRRGVFVPFLVTSEPTRVQIEGPRNVVELGANMQLDATVRGEFDEAITVGSLDWSTEDDSILEVSQSGLVTPKALGTTRISASFTDPRDMDVIVGRFELEVIQPTPQTIRVSPDGAEIQVGGQVRLESEVISELGSLLLMTDPIMWSVTPSSVAEIDQTGLLRARAEGTAIVTARLDTLTAQVELFVRAPRVAAIVFEPRELVLESGETANLSSKVLSGSVTQMSGVTLTWSSQDPTVATVDPSGRVTAVGIGRTFIETTAPNGVKGAALVTVPLRFREVKTTETHACALTPEDEMYCWGDDFSGQTGTNTEGNVIDTPLPVDTARTWKSFDLGDRFTCAIATDDTLWCWGNNQTGRIGNDTTDGFVPTPQPAGGGKTYKSISIGDRHACAISTSDKVFCWGEDTRGQLGNTMDIGSVRSPVEVASPPRGVWAQVSAGSDHTCALTSMDEVYCWGSDQYGQSGANKSTDIELPLKVPNVTAKTLEVGNQMTCILKSDDTLWCWGRNDDGRLGDGTNADRTTPVQLLTGKKISQVSADGRLNITSTCALTDMSELYCWGSINSSATPLLYSLETDVVTMDAGALNACGINSKQWAYCGGAGPLGQRTIYPFADEVDTSIRFTDLDASYLNTCGIDDSQQLHCWGENGSGQLGDGSSFTSVSPKRVELPAPVAQASIGTNISIVGVTTAACATLTTGEIYCWGANNNGQLGVGGLRSEREPKKIIGIQSYTEVTRNGGHTCGLNPGGAAYCWGDNILGQLGAGGRVRGINSTRPVRVVYDLETTVPPLFFDLEAGQDTTCGIDRRTQRAFCWGRGESGELGNGAIGNKSNPRSNDGSPMNRICMGDDHGCSLTTSGKAECWGDNNRGQLGIGPGSIIKLQPEPVVGNDNFVDLACGSRHTCAINLSGMLFCWGWNIGGQLGNGSVDNLPIPTAIASDKKFVDVTAGDQHTCALSTGGETLCWGSNSNGQLGGTRPARPITSF